MNGRPVRESTGTAKEKEAEQFLKRREGAAAEGRPTAPRLDRLRYKDLAEDLRRYYATTGKRGKVESETRFAHLDRFFTGTRVVSITPALVARYVEDRQRQGPRTGPSIASWGPFPCSRRCPHRQSRPRACRGAFRRHRFRPSLDRTSLGASRQTLSATTSTCGACRARTRAGRSPFCHAPHRSPWDQVCAISISR